MASKISTIWSLFNTHLETLTINGNALTAEKGPVNEITNHPHAQTFILTGSGEVQTDVSTYMYRPFELLILIEGTIVDVSDALEDISTLWFNATRRGALSTNNVLEFYVTDVEEAVSYPGDMAVGSITFFFRVSYTV